MLQLQAGRMVCEVVPRLGGCIAGLWLGGIPVLGSGAAAAVVSARQSVAYPIVPFTSQGPQARVQWQGTQQPLVRTEAPSPHEIHGIGWQRPWEVLDSDGVSAMLAYEHPADGAWPFAFDCSQTVRVGSQSLALTLSITNQSREAMPAGMGWHLAWPKRQGGRIAFAAADAAVDTELSVLEEDCCIDGWRGELRIADASLRVTLTSSLQGLLLFARRDLNHVEAGPVSAGTPMLQPGESATAQVTMTVEAA